MEIVQARLQEAEVEKKPQAQQLLLILNNSRQKEAQVYCVNYLLEVINLICIMNKEDNKR